MNSAILVISILTGSGAQADFQAQGCMAKIAQSDINGRSCEMLSQLAELACSSETPVELNGSDVAQFENAEKQKQEAWDDVKKLTGEGHQSAACEARRKGSEAEKSINLIKARNCEQLIQRCETSCSQLQICAEKLSNVTQRLGEIGSGYGRYTSSLRQDGERAGSMVRQCRSFQARVQQARRQAEIHEKNRDVEVICRDKTKKHEADAAISPVASDSKAQPNTETDIVSGAGKSDEFSKGEALGRVDSSYVGNETMFRNDSTKKISGMGQLENGSKLQSEQIEKIPDNKNGFFKRAFARLISTVAESGLTSEILAGAKKFGQRLGLAADRTKKPRLIKITSATARDMKFADGVTPATGPTLFAKISHRFYLEDRLGNWDDKPSAKTTLVAGD